MVPSQPQQDAYQRAIMTLAKQHHTPHYVPHVTLIPSLSMERAELVEVLKTLAQDTHRFTIHFEKIEGTPSYWRSLFLKATLSHELDTLFKKAVTALKPYILHCGEVLIPHMSLVYGDFSNTQKEAMIASLIEMDLPLFFPVHSIAIVSMNPDTPDGWHVIYEVPLHK